MNPDRPGCVRSVGVEMKPVKVKIKLIRLRKSDTEDKLKETGVADLNIFVKMPDTLHFDPDAEVKTVDNEVRMNPPGQILVERFYF